MSRALRWAAIGLLLTAAAWGQEEPEPVRFVLTKKLFWNSEAEDVLPTAEMVAEDIGERMGRKVTVEIVSGDLQELHDQLRSGQYQFVFSDALDYTMLKLGNISQDLPREPLDVKVVAAAVTPPDRGTETPGCTSAVILVREGLAAGGFEALKGTRFVSCPQSDADTSMLFVDALVKAQGAASRQEFFGSVVQRTRQDACITALQRGAADVTCVPEIMYQTRLLANGRIRGVRPFMMSKRYAAYLCFSSATTDGALRREMRDQLLTIGETRRGTDLLEDFHITGFADLAPEVLERVRRIVLCARGEEANVSALVAPETAELSIPDPGALEGVLDLGGGQEESVEPTPSHDAD